MSERRTVCIAGTHSVAAVTPSSQPLTIGSAIRDPVHPSRVRREAKRPSAESSHRTDSPSRLLASMNGKLNACGAARRTPGQHEACGRQGFGSPPHTRLAE